MYFFFPTTPREESQADLSISSSFSLLEGLEDADDVGFPFALADI